MELYIYAIPMYKARKNRTHISSNVLVTSLNNTNVSTMIYQRTTKNLFQYNITYQIVIRINLISSKKLAYLAVNILVVVQISLVRSWLRKTSYSFRFLKDHAVSLIP